VKKRNWKRLFTKCTSKHHNYYNFKNAKNHYYTQAYLYGGS
jgi:hypothetical protein